MMDTASHVVLNANHHPPMCGFVGQEQVHAPAPAPTSAVPSYVNKADGTAAVEPHYLPISQQRRRVPCKARGIPERHNAQTAYFDIPINAKHGMLLVCSHPLCAESGRQFRYCAVCEIPVAKRNFMKRHAHGLVTSKRMSRSEGHDPSLPMIDDDIHGVCDLEEGPCAGMKRRRSVSFDAAECLQQGFKNESPKKQATNYPHHDTTQGQVHESASPLPNTTSADLDNNDFVHQQQDPAISVNMQLMPRDVQWLALLGSRPPTEDSDAMYSWIEKVIQVSETLQEPQTSITTHTTTTAARDTLDHQSSGESSTSYMIQMAEAGGHHRHEHGVKHEQYQRRRSSGNWSLKDFAGLFS